MRCLSPLIIMFDDDKYSKWGGKAKEKEAENFSTIQIFEFLRDNSMMKM